MLHNETAGETAGINLLSKPFHLHHPMLRGEAQVRLSTYKNGSLGIQLIDKLGQILDSPTVPHCRGMAESLVSSQYKKSHLLGIRPSSINNGVASALIEAGVLKDLGHELPTEQNWARLMVANQTFFEDEQEARLADRPEYTPMIFAEERAVAERLAMEEEDINTPFMGLKDAKLKPFVVPIHWQDSCIRIQTAFRRRAMFITKQDAMLAWREHSGRMENTPMPLPQTEAEIYRMLRPYFE